MATAAGGFGQGQDSRFDVQFAYPVEETRVQPSLTMHTPTTPSTTASTPATRALVTVTDEPAQSADVQKELEKALKSPEFEKAMQDLSKTFSTSEFFKNWQDFEKSFKAAPDFKFNFDEDAFARSFEGLKNLSSLRAQDGARSGAILWSNYSAAEQKKVNASFSSAPAREVLAWLQKQGVSFVVADSQIDTSRKVTLNASNVPLGALVDSLATALGGHWENQNGIRVFQTGPGRLTIPSIRYSVPAVPAPPKAFDRNLPRVYSFGNSKPVIIGATDLKGLVNSLTKSQKELQAKQGYLKLSDLTPAQRKFLGGRENPTGKFELRIKIDGQEVVIKND